MERLSSFCLKYSRIQEKDLATAMGDVAQDHISDRIVAAAMPKIIAENLSGTKAENTVGQLLVYAGRDVQPGSTRQDLTGVDFISSGVFMPNLYIDAKSRGWASNHGWKPGQSYEITGKGKILIVPPCTGNDYEGGMVLPAATAERLAPGFDTILLDAENELLATMSDRSEVMA